MARFLTQRLFQGLIVLLWMSFVVFFLLVLFALSISICIAVPAGIFAAKRPRSLTDQAINLACFAGISLPSFWLALVLIIVFAVLLGVLPAGGMGDPTGAGGILDKLRYLV